MPQAREPYADEGDQPTEVIAPVEAGDTADATPADPDAQSWLGIAAFVTGALALSVVAIVLGHLGLTAARRGRATTRGFALAGTILGYVGLVLTAMLIWLAVRGPAPETVDAFAHHDVVEVGNAVADAVADSGAVPPVAVAGDDYDVGGITVEGLLQTQRTVEVTDDGEAGWCLELTYVGGTAQTWSFDSAAGVTEGGTCATE